MRRHVLYRSAVQPLLLQASVHSPIGVCQLLPCNISRALLEFCCGVMLALLAAWTALHLALKVLHSAQHLQLPHHLLKVVHVQQQMRQT
jgi:hypothetical protein